MPGLYNDRVILQRKEKIGDTGLSKEYKWVDVRSLSCRKAAIDTNAQAKFQQLGHSNVSMYLQFRGLINIKIGEHRFKNDRTDEVYIPANPPEHRGSINKITRVYVKKELVQNVEEPDNG